MSLDLALFRHLIEATPDAVLLVGADGRILHANQAVAHVFGHDPEALRGQLVEVLVPQGHRPAHSGNRRRFLAEGRPRHMGSGLVVEGLHADGSTVPLDIQLAPLDHDGQRVTVAVARNIAHILRLQEELARYAQQLEQSLAESEHDRARLQALDAEKNKLLGITAHDLRNPLAALRVFTDLLACGALGAASDAHQPLIHQMARSVDYMSRLVDQILDWSAIEAGHLVLDCEPTDIADLVRIALGVEALAAKAHGVQIEADIAADIGMARIDPNKVEQVVHNLVYNAVRHSPDGRSVEVRLFRRADQVELQVVDRGPGVPPEERGRIFEPYSRGAGQAGKGAGLGLAIVAAIVQGHDGAVEIGETPGGGATFTVRLPLDRA